MKKKFFSFIVAFAFVLTSAICLTACGGDKEEKYYYDVDAPQNIVVQIDSKLTDSDGKAYVLEDNDFTCSFYAKEGYEISGGLTIKVDGIAKEWTSTSNGFYTYTFTPNGDFKIKVEGTVIEKYCNVSFKKSEGFEDNAFEDVYIKYGTEEEQTLLNFLNNSSLANQNLKYDTTIEFWIYTYGYSGNLSIHGVDPEFFNEDGKFGLHVKEKVNIDEEITIYNYGLLGTHFALNEDCLSSTFDGINYKNMQTSEPYNIADENIKIRMYLNEDNTKLILELKKDISDAVLKSLKLKINRQNVALTFNKNLDNMITAEVELLKPYEYNNTAYFAYNYEFDLNFYNLDYFDGCDINNYNNNL